MILIGSFLPGGEATGFFVLGWFSFSPLVFGLIRRSEGSGVAACRCCLYNEIISFFPACFYFSEWFLRDLKWEADLVWGSLKGKLVKIL